MTMKIYQKIIKYKKDNGWNGNGFKILNNGGANGSE